MFAPANQYAYDRYPHEHIVAPPVNTNFVTAPFPPSEPTVPKSQLVAD